MAQHVVKSENVVKHVRKNVRDVIVAEEDVADADADGEDAKDVKDGEEDVAADTEKEDVGDA